MMATRFLTALPVYNERSHVADVLAEVRRYGPEILVVNDGSTDGTREVLEAQRDLHVVHHPSNRGYGAALVSAFEFARAGNYEIVVTIDCDGQHEPRRIPRFVAACDGLSPDGRPWDIVSGSRYLKRYPGDSEPPPDRRKINEQLTAELNRRLGYELTDAFCGFKAYRVAALSGLRITQTGYAMPLELWVQAARHGLRVRELPVPLVYLEEKRSFGGSLDDALTRLEYYHLVLDRSMAAEGTPHGRLWAGTIPGECA